MISEKTHIAHAGTNRPYARVIPDFLIRESAPSERKLVLDAKYKLWTTPCTRLGCTESIEATKSSSTKTMSSSFTPSTVSSLCLGWMPLI